MGQPFLSPRCYSHHADYNPEHLRKIRSVYTSAVIVKTLCSDAILPYFQVATNALLIALLVQITAYSTLGKQTPKNS